MDHEQLAGIFMKVDQTFPEMDFFNSSAYKQSNPGQKANKASAKKSKKADKGKAKDQDKQESWILGPAKIVHISLCRFEKIFSANSSLFDIPIVCRKIIIKCSIKSLSKYRIVRSVT